jgi:integrase/recombinase XerD
LSLWLASRRSPETARAYRQAIADLVSCTGKRLEEMTRQDVIAWINARKNTLSPATLAQRIAGVSSFYRFCHDDFVGEDGRPLSISNPAASRSIRPQVEPYGKSSYLSPDQARALLHAIDRASARGARDYALILGYLMLGRRNSEWRTVRWEDFERMGNEIILRWHGKGKQDQRLSVPRILWKAINAIPGQSHQGYLFTARGGNPLSARAVGRILKKYARLAGLEWESIHVHTLRHSAAMLRKESGDDIQAISEFLRHSSLAITQIYLHKIEGQRVKYGRVADLLGLEEA